MLAGDFAKGGFCLHGDEILEIVDFQKRLCAISDMPNKRGSDLYRIARRIIDLDRFNVVGLETTGDTLNAEEGIHPAKPGRLIGALIFAEEGKDRAFVRLDHEYTEADEDRDANQQGRDQQWQEGKRAGRLPDMDLIREHADGNGDRRNDQTYGNIAVVGGNRLICNTRRHENLIKNDVFMIS
nr:MULTISPECIES: hypothetical protein [Agrobacterium]